MPHHRQYVAVAPQSLRDRGATPAPLRGQPYAAPSGLRTTVRLAKSQKNFFAALKIFSELRQAERALVATL